MSDDTVSLTAFRRLLETATTRTGADSMVLMTDSLVGQAAGAVLRCCAVPHEFDCALLRHVGTYSEAEASDRYAQFSELSIMQVNANALSVHERWRRQLWNWWLDERQRTEFVALNEKLVDWFTVPHEGSDDTAARRRMFHLIGCRQHEGLEVFEALFRAARLRHRFSECSLLLRLVHEYDSLLKPITIARLTYHEGVIASDLRNWDQTLALLRPLADSPSADLGLRIEAEVRSACALRHAGRVEEALTVLERTQSRFAAELVSTSYQSRVLHELGEVYRDLGRVDEASETLSLALSIANDEDADVADMLNSLGTVQLKLLDIDRAIESFRASLDHLNRRGDAIRSGGVLNNLGLAQLERCDWKAAEASLSASLAAKRAAGDQLGQATTLFNLSRAQMCQGHFEDALHSAERAAELYEACGEAHGRTRARMAAARVLRRAGRLTECEALLSTIASEAEMSRDIPTATTARAELVRLKRHPELRRWVWVIGGALILLIVVALVHGCHTHGS